MGKRKTKQEIGIPDCFIKNTEHAGKNCIKL